MGLDVTVVKVVIPNKKLETLKDVSLFEKKYKCNFYDSENCPAIHGTKFEVEIPVEYIDFDPLFKERGLNQDDYDCICSGYNYFEFIHKSIDREKADYETIESNKIIFESLKFPVKVLMTKGFFVGEEVGYQRKGANAQFYKDGKWDYNTVVVDKRTLLEDWNKYFSDPDDNYYGENSRKNFEKNIINNFVEGETIVCYW